MKNKLFFYSVLMLVIIFISGCSTTKIDSINESVSVANKEINRELDANKELSNLRIINSSIEKIEIYHFHSNRQCNVCKTIGANLDETIQRYFLEEVKSGKIVYGHINVEDPANKQITMMYGATGTSLWIGVYDKDGLHIENNQEIWYKLQDREEFILYLKGHIEKRLAGDMN